MYDIRKEFIEFSRLSREELFARCPGLVFDREDSGVLYFTANVPEAFIRLVDETWYLEKYRDHGYFSVGYYRDGTVACLEGRSHIWQFKQNGVTFAEVRPANSSRDDSVFATSI